MIDSLPSAVYGSRCMTVHRRVLGYRTVLAAAHLDAAVGQRVLDEQIRYLDGKRLKEVHATQCSCSYCTCHLEVARTREDDAALHNVVGHEGVQRSRSGRAEDDGAV
jgi:hypothetical protein